MEVLNLTDLRARAMQVLADGPLHRLQLAGVLGVPLLDLERATRGHAWFDSRQGHLALSDLGWEQLDLPSAAGSGLPQAANGREPGSAPLPFPDANQERQDGGDPFVLIRGPLLRCRNIYHFAHPRPGDRLHGGGRE